MLSMSSFRLLSSLISLRLRKTPTALWRRFPWRDIGAVNPAHKKLPTARVGVQSSRKCAMPEAGLIMKAKQLAPNIRSEAVRAGVWPLLDQRFIDRQIS